MTPKEQRRTIAKLFADHADEWASEWAATSTGRDGRPVEAPEAQAALRDAFAAMLRRAGLDYVTRLPLPVAAAFPGFKDAAPSDPAAAWLAVGLRCFDDAVYVLSFATRDDLAGLSASEVERFGRTRALGQLARETAPPPPETLENSP